jgi:hypothetical protein
MIGVNGSSAQAKHFNTMLGIRIGIAAKTSFFIGVSMSLFCMFCKKKKLHLDFLPSTNTILFL